MLEIPLENIESLDFNEYLSVSDAGPNSSEYQTLVKENSWGQSYEVTPRNFFTKESEDQHWAVLKHMAATRCSYDEAIDFLGITT